MLEVLGLGFWELLRFAHRQMLYSARSFGSTEIPVKVSALPPISDFPSDEAICIIKSWAVSALAVDLSQHDDRSFRALMRSSAQIE